ncbi:MAG: aldehyde dehydrogenase (NADP(+)) [Trueperaceae bacterium]
MSTSTEREWFGGQLIGMQRSRDGREEYPAVDSKTGDALPGRFVDATPDEIDAACTGAAGAFAAYAAVAPQRRAAFLRAICRELDAVGPRLTSRGQLETGLPAGRLEGERARTTGQLKLFATLIEEGSWVDARIDPALPERAPLPRPDLRRMLIPLGPVAVFGASNFPLAFSVPGGDTASALAAGCPVVVKAHPAHPGVSELAALAILRAAKETGMPEGVFNLVHGRSNEVGGALVRHPDTQAVGFTGSLRAGRALFDLAAARPQPIPVYAEMGSVNPVVLLPGALAERAADVAKSAAAAVTLGVGQFCTNPGLLIGVNGAELEEFAGEVAAALASTPPATMLYGGICQAFRGGVERLRGHEGVELLESPAAKSLSGPIDTPADSGQRGPNGAPTATAPNGPNDTPAYLFRADGATFLANQELQEELFGPATLLVACRDEAELREVVGSLAGSLTATLQTGDGDQELVKGLLPLLERRAGRVIFNGMPTGVDVGHAMNHGGPYPATTDSRSTSVGSAAIHRFVRPVSYQEAPAEHLPEELRDENPRGVLRMVDGWYTREGLRRR